MIRLSELLAIRCFAPTFRGVAPEQTRVKLVRHKDPNLDLDALRTTHLTEQPGAESWLDIYQKYQPTRVFDNCDQIVVFMGEATYPDSRFIGVYDVSDGLPAAEFPLPSGCPHPEWAQAQYYYHLAKRTGLEDLEDRLVIAWQGPPQAWNQWFADREVLEIRRRPDNNALRA